MSVDTSAPAYTSETDSCAASAGTAMKPEETWFGDGGIISEDEVGKRLDAQRQRDCEQRRVIMAVSRELWAWVIERDARYVWEHSEEKIHHHVGYFKFRASRKVICIVPTIDPRNRIECGGKQEVDHVKDQPMMGKRAPDDEAHLVAMCQNHNTWNPPSKELRQAEREYLKRHVA